MKRINISVMKVIAQLCLFALPLELLAEDYSITLKGNADESIIIGTLQTTASDNKISTYKINWHSEKFEEHFLSMRPFKCIPGEEKLWCHTPYPYEIKRQLDGKDFTDLEYDLIFVWKPEGEYGVNLWNGVYYQLAKKDNGWEGIMQDYDLNILGIPPNAGELRPIKSKDLYEASIEDHLFPFIEITLVN